MTAKVQVIRPGSCDAIGGQETINAVVEEAVPDNYYSFTACIRGPNLARTTTWVTAFLRSTQFSKST